MTDELSGREPARLDLRIAVQGGGMRVAYGLGAMEALRETAVGLVRSFSCTSAGSFTPLVFLSPDPERLIERIFSMIVSKRFINPKRIYKISDVDFFIDEVIAPAFDVSVFDKAETPEVWVSLVDAEDATLHYKRLDASNGLDLVRATNAVPVLYSRSVRLSDGRSYIDGGVGDPLPLLHAVSLASEHDVVLPLATKPTRMLERPSRGRFERVAVAIDRRISRPVRHLLLAPNPLVEPTLRLFRRDAVGSIRILGCEPSDDDLIFSRTTTDVAELQKLRACGYSDFKAVLDRIPDASISSRDRR